MPVVLTNASVPASFTREVMVGYRRKNRVEESFHEIKSPLALRSLFVSRNERIRAHLMVCGLACALYNAMDKRVSKDSPSLPRGSSVRWPPPRSIDCASNRPVKSVNRNCRHCCALTSTLECAPVVTDSAVRSVLETIQTCLYPLILC